MKYEVQHLTICEDEGIVQADSDAEAYKKVMEDKLLVSVCNDYYDDFEIEAIEELK